MSAPPRVAVPAFGALVVLVPAYILIDGLPADEEPVASWAPTAGAITGLVIA